MQCGTRLAAACAHCGTELPAEARFCPRCGEAVGVAPQQPPRRDPRAYTPKHLADKILTGKSALEGERKQVTVLFADVKGSVELAEKVDPEEWHRILDRFFAILSEGVHRFEGTVNQFTGDGIMALFGAPIAHADHARRACHAALALREELRGYADELARSRGVEFSVRMGLNSGEVIVGRIGDDLRMDYTAQGHTVGLASRLEQLAGAGSVYLSEDTAALVSDFFRLRDLGEFEVKGVREPLRVFELEGVGPERSRLDIARARGFSPFLGRDRELEKLESALASAKSGHGQIVAVHGEAGVGKSRLCLEFAERCRARGVQVYAADCVPYGRALPLSPVQQFLQSFFRIEEADDPRAARKKIAEVLLRQGPGMEETLHLVYDFMGVPDPEHPLPEMEVETGHRLFVQTLRRICMTCGETPTLIVFEDLQWADAGTEAFLEQIADSVATNPALLLVTYRPEYEALWLRGRTHDQLRLMPLASDTVDELLAEVLGTDPGLRALATRIRERAGGNPFFVEEVVHSLADEGSLEGQRGAHRLVKPVDELAIPPTIQGVVAERIDRLKDGQKEVLQMAAVIGREFSQQLLEKIVDLPEAELVRVLRELESSEFIHPKRVYPRTEYAFRQPLTQEVAYRSQLMDRRASLHAKVARLLEAEKCEASDDCAALLAHHWERAGDALKAAQWSLQAAEWTAPRDPRESLRHYRKAIALLDTLPESPEMLSLAVLARAGVLGGAAFLPVDPSEVTLLFEQGKALAKRGDDQRGLVKLFSSYGLVQASSGNADAALEHAKEAVRLARELDDPEFEASMRAMILFAHYGAGRLREAFEYAADAESRLPGGGASTNDQVTAENFLSRGFRGLMLTFAGGFEDAKRELERAIQFAHEQGKTYSWMHGALVDLAGFTLQNDGAMQHARAGVAAAEQFGSPFFTALAARSLGRAYMLEERWPEAIASLEQALGLIRETRTAVELEGVVLALLAEAQLAAGDGERARALAEEGVRIGEKRHTRLSETHARLALAHILLCTQGTRESAAVSEELGRVSALIEETGARSYLPFVYMARAELANAEGDAATRERELLQARDLFQEMGAPAQAERINARLG